MGGKWGRMRRASKGLGDQEATGRELEPFEKAGRTAHPLRSYFLNTGKASRGSSSCSRGKKAESCPRNRQGGEARAAHTAPVGTSAPVGISARFHPVFTPRMLTLLAASTLAQTAAMAARSSRRFCFFSFALLDFL